MFENKFENENVEAVVEVPEVVKPKVKKKSREQILKDKMKLAKEKLEAEQKAAKERLKREEDLILKQIKAEQEKTNKKVAEAVRKHWTVDSDWNDLEAVIEEILGDKEEV